MVVRGVCGWKGDVCGKERCVWWEGKCVVVREVCSGKGGVW